MAMISVESVEIATLILKHAIKPVIKSIEKEYGNETKKLLKTGIGKILEKFPFQKKELDLIEAEIVDADVDILTDDKKFLEFIQNNNQIQELITEIVRREPNINIAIEKSYNEIVIDGSNNSISF